jgi:hypothetical protein
VHCQTQRTPGRGELFEMIRYYVSIHGMLAFVPLFATGPKINGCICDGVFGAGPCLLVVS